MRIPSVSSLRGEILLPADKSISHRYAILGAMATGTTKISNFSASQDCQSTLRCLQALGVQIRRSREQVQIESSGWESFCGPEQPLDAGNSGTTIRLISALLAASSFRSMIGGDDSLNRRPMNRIIAPLSLMGARIQAQRDEYPPLKIEGTRLKGIRYALPIASAQVKSCILLAGLMAEGRTVVEESLPSRDHTERALPFFNAPFQQHGTELTVTGPVNLQPSTVDIPGDFSAAVFFIIAALMIPRSEICLRRVGLNPSRSGLLQLLEQAGAAIEKTNMGEVNGEPTGDLTVRFTVDVLENFPSQIDGSWIPNLIDEIPILAVFGTGLKHGFSVRGAEELRKKESDRIHSIVLNLQNLGVKVQEFKDGFFIPPGQELKGGHVETFGDHRIAMAFAVAALKAQGPVTLDDPACVSVSFPDFFAILESVSEVR